MADTKRRTKGSQADQDQNHGGFKAPIKKKLEKEKSQYGSYGAGESSGTFRRYVEEGAYKKRGEGRSEGEERPRRAPRATGRPNDRWSEDRPRRAPGAAGRPNDRWSEDRPRRAPEGAGRPNDRWSEDRPRRAPEGAGRPNDRWSEDRPKRTGAPFHKSEGPNRWSQDRDSRFKSDRNSGNRNFRDDDRNSRGRSAPGRPRPTSAPFGDRNRNSSSPRSFARPAASTGLSLSPRMIAAMKAAVGREIPEAMKQLAEAKNCIFQAVTALMTINEKLVEQSAGKSDILNKLSAEYSLLTDALCEIQGMEKEQKDILLQAQEHFMFQDLTGQRLNKVSDVLTSLNTLLADVSGFSKTPDQPKIKIPEKSKDEKMLSGPQAKGEGLDQDAIDAMLQSV